MNKYYMDLGKNGVTVCLVIRIVSEIIFVGTGFKTPEILINSLGFVGIPFGCLGLYGMITKDKSSGRYK